MLIIIFWILIATVLYTYYGYTILLIFLNLIKMIIKPNMYMEFQVHNYPEITLLIAAYNEKELVDKKMKDCLSLNYPKDKLKILWVTDGSNDGTPEELKKYPGVQVIHQPIREGKSAAINRAMQYVSTPYVVFCDANTILAPDSLRHLFNVFVNEDIGCVAGAKKISKDYSLIAAGAGEGTYWEYESFIKKLESDFYSTLGAAGELYAIRTELFESIDPDIIVDDFAVSLSIASKGKLIKYAEKAYAVEAPSLNIKEELKRKIRIAAGGIQILVRMKHLLNIFKYGFLSVEFFSHKVLRWTLVPWAFPAIFLINIFICQLAMWKSSTYNSIMVIQGIFYLVVLAGAIFEKHATRFKFFFIPYYLVIMNYAQICGLFRFLTGKHSAIWEKVKRS